MIKFLAQVIHPWRFDAPLLVILDTWSWGPGL